MSRIAHASISENGTVNGVKGDSTGKEVCIRDYYVHKYGWNYVLRPSADIADKVARNAENGAKNNRIGYSQSDRDSLHTEAQRVGYDLSKITTPCNCDCSSFITTCAIAAGVKSLEYTGNAPTTRTMESAFLRTGKFTILKDKKYLTSDKYLMRGDILVSISHHTVIVLDNGSGVKSIDEIVQEVLDNKWGVGEERKRRLTEAGYPYETIRAEINKRLKAKPKTMSTTDKGIKFIQSFESCRLTAYKDVAGVWTIGWGNTNGVHEGMKITQAQADEMFRKDLKSYEDAVNALGFTLTPQQFDALVSFSYNCGKGNLKNLVANRDYKQIADAMLLYNKARVNGVLKPVAGLTRRRKAEREMFLS